MKPIISVIVPVYNAEDTIKKCVDSILSQTFVNIQIVLVDDGSPDGAGIICDEYASKDSRVVVIHQDNKGVMEARRCGVECSVSEYISFVDADDHLSPDALESMLSYMEQTVDVVMLESRFDAVYDKIEYCDALLNFRHWRLTGKLFRRQLFDDYVLGIPPEFKVGEDFLSNLRMLSRLSGLVVSKPLRKYIINKYNPKSVTKNHISNYEYERMMILEVKRTLTLTDFYDEIKQSFLRWETNYLSGMIGYRYEVDFHDIWITEYKNECKSVRLGFRGMITCAAISCKAFRTVFIVERWLKNHAREILRFCEDKYRTINMRMISHTTN